MLPGVPSVGIGSCFGIGCDAHSCSPTDTSFTGDTGTDVGSGVVEVSSIGAGCAVSAFSSSGIVLSVILGDSGASGCVAITAGDSDGAGVSSAGSFRDHTATHKARQAANTVVVMIRFFIFLLPFRTWKERPFSSPYSERLSALFRIDSVPWRAATPAQIRR